MGTLHNIIYIIRTRTRYVNCYHAHHLLGYDVNLFMLVKKKKTLQLNKTNCLPMKIFISSTIYTLLFLQLYY